MKRLTQVVVHGGPRDLAMSFCFDDGEWYEMEDVVVAPELAIDWVEAIHAALKDVGVRNNECECEAHAAVRS